MEENNIIIDQVTEAAGDVITNPGSTDLIKKLGVIGGFATVTVAVGFGVKKLIEFVKSKKDQTEADETAADEPTLEVVSSDEDNTAE